MSATAAAAPSALYDRYCLPCHGASGDGSGPAAPWLAPAPRDFTSGRYKWRSTASGKAPTTADLARAVREGAPGTSMPSFGGILDETQIATLVAEIVAFAPARFAGAPPDPVELPPEPATLPDGRALFSSLGCAACHGERGQGDGPSATTLPSGRPFDLTASPLRRGATRRDIALSIATGLDGTAMPAMAGLSAAQLWALAAFVDGIRARAAPPLPGPIDPHARTPASGLHLDPQGPPPPSLPPAAASLSAEQCARCHAKQHREWSRSLHAGAVSPGIVGQLVTSAKVRRVELTPRCWRFPRTPSPSTPGTSAPTCASPATSSAPTPRSPESRSSIRTASG